MSQTVGPEALGAGQLGRGLGWEVLFLAGREGELRAGGSQDWWKWMGGKQKRGRCLLLLLLLTLLFFSKLFLRNNIQSDE